MSISTLLTGGLYPASQGFGPIVSGGIAGFLTPTVTLNPNERPNPGLAPQLNLTVQQLEDLQSITSVRSSTGSLIVPNTSGGFTSIGNGYQLGFDVGTLLGRIVPSLNPHGLQGAADQFGASNVFTGADMRLMIESSVTASDGRRYAKQMIEATTLSVSVHREVTQVRAGGYINPKGFALGKRTIAGTLIVTQFNADALLTFLQSVMMIDGSKDSTFTKVDQLPPFNMTMIFTNEAGYAAYRTLLGVKFVTDGVTYSIQDMLSEQVMSWMALDFTPLMPLTLTNLYTPTNANNRNTARERTPTDLMKQLVRAI